MTHILITVNDRPFKAELHDNETVSTFTSRLPLSVTMNDLHSNEKYFSMDAPLPVKSRKVKTIKSGDLMLYGDSTIVLFYKSFDTPYSYTPLGRLENTENLEDALGSGDAEVNFEIEPL